MIQSVAALLISRSRFLLIKRRYGAFRGKWGFPSGNVAAGETQFTAIQRKIRDELGVEIFPYQILKTFVSEQKGEPIHQTLIQCSLNDQAKRLLSDKNHSTCAWTYILNTEQFLLAPLDKEIITFLRNDLFIIPTKSKGPGFASMDAAKRKAIAGKAGKIAHEKGRAHRYTSEEAKRAGRIGGKRSGSKKRKAK